MGMMTKVIRRPFNRRILQCPGAVDQERGLYPVGTFKAAVSHQSMVAHRNAQSTYEVKQHKQRPVKPRVMIQISVQRDTHERAEDDRRKQENRPAPMVTSDDRPAHFLLRQGGVD